MANNRLWAVCKDDNKGIVLCKNYSDWYKVGADQDHNKFFMEHVDCPSNRGCGENIKFITEVDDDDLILLDFRDYSDVRIYLKGDEEKPRVKEYLDSRKLTKEK